MNTITHEPQASTLIRPLFHEIEPDVFKVRSKTHNCCHTVRVEGGRLACSCPWGVQRRFRPELKACWHIREVEGYLQRAGKAAAPVAQEAPLLPEVLRPVADPDDSYLDSMFD